MSGQCSLTYLTLVSDTSSLGASGVLSVLRTHVLEQSVQCLLMRGDTVYAGKQLQDVVDTCHSHHMLVYSHRAVLHTLLVCPLGVCICTSRLLPL